MIDSTKSELDPRIHVAIRSYKRAGLVKTLTPIPFAYVWVPESQGDDYRKHYGDRVITIPDSEDGNSSRKFNAILNRAPTPWTLILDDDISKIGYFEKGVELAYSPDTLIAMINRYFLLACEFGVHLWGLNQNYDPLSYRTYTPFSLLSPVLGPFTGHLEPELRYDESVPLKEDYDFWLQNIARYHKTLRINKAHYYHDHGVSKKMTGGLSGIRTMAAETENINRMKAKWGPLFNSRALSGGKARGADLLNSLCNVPISGV